MKANRYSIKDYFIAYSNQVANFTGKNDTDLFKVSTVLPC